MPPFEVIWQRIVALQGEQFVTKAGLPFEYRIEGDALYPSRTEYRLSRNNVEKAYALAPLPGPGAINRTIRGPSYIWAILHDQRVSQGAWSS